MIIDIHTHVFPEKIAKRAMEKLSKASGIIANTEGSVLSLIDSMEKNEIDYSVILPVATSVKQVESINETAVSNMELYGDRGIISFGGIHPDCPDYSAIIKSLKANGVKGIKIHPPYQGVEADDIRYKRILYLASENDMITLTHGGYDIGRMDADLVSPKKVRNLIDDVHPKNFIIAHMGGWKYYDETVKYLAGQDVYFDTSFTLSPKEAVYVDFHKQRELMRLHGVDKILFGTDSPWANQGICKDFIKDMGLTADEVDCILYKNAKKLLNI